MSIDKQGSGMPEFDIHRRTTKVNLAMVTSIVLFLAIVAAVIVWVARRGG